MNTYVKNDSMLADLQGLIKIKSISCPPEGDFPFGQACHEALEYCLSLCDSLGLETKRCGNYTGYAQIGSGERLMGILAHVDVVPEGSGWNTDPYEGTILDERIYGRGVIDDKGPVIAVIHAMKELLDSGAPLDKRIRLIFGCSEETGDWQDIEYYKKTEEIPDFGFTPDADFPLIYGEKGIVVLNLKMKLEEAGLLDIQGGTAHNMVPDTCSVTFLNEANSEVTIIKKGKAAHGSTPDEGINAIGLALKEVPGAFASFYNTCIRETTDGKLLDCYLRDDESGEITVNPGIVACKDGYVNLVLNIRFPITFSRQDVVDKISKRVSEYGITIDILGGQKPVYTDKNSSFIKCLMNAYQEVSGDLDSQPMTMGGGTYAKAMENIVAFGPVFPGRECTEHQANEYIYIADLYKARQIYKLAMERA